MILFCVSECTFTCEIEHEKAKIEVAVTQKKEFWTENRSKVINLIEIKEIRYVG